MIGILTAILAFIPAMIANSLAVVFGGPPPIDAGKKIGEKRVLGDGKTWRGLFGGGISAAIVGLVLYFLLRPFFSLYPSPLLYRTLMILVSLSFGSLLGDIGGSFVKRRRDLPRGENSPILDRYDFVVGAFLLTFVVQPDWMIKTYFEGNGWIGTLIIIIGIPLLHRGVNIIGYKIGLKEEPW